MPIIQMNLLEGRSQAMKEAAVAAVTEALVRTLGVRPDQVRIMIHELAAQHYAVNGQTLKMRDQQPAPSTLAPQQEKEAA